MSNLDESSYEDHKNCTAGDTAIIKTDDGTNYTGTVIKTPGATVYIQANSGQILETRRVRDDDTGELAIFLAIDAKDIEYEEPEKGVNPDGLEITRESGTLSFDKQVTEFTAEERELTIG